MGDDVAELRPGDCVAIPPGAARKPCALARARAGLGRRGLRGWRAAGRADQTLRCAARVAKPCDECARPQRRGAKPPGRKSRRRPPLPGLSHDGVRRTGRTAKELSVCTARQLERGDHRDGPAVAAAAAADPHSAEARPAGVKRSGESSNEHRSHRVLKSVIPALSRSDPFHHGLGLTVDTMWDRCSLRRLLNQPTEGG